MKGIEPSYSAWKAAALPLSYTRKPFIIKYLQFRRQVQACFRLSGTVRPIAPVGTGTNSTFRYRQVASPFWGPNSSKIILESHSAHVDLLRSTSFAFAIMRLICGLGDAHDSSGLGLGFSKERL